MSSPARAWFAAWQATVPRSLRAVVEQAVGAADDTSSDVAAILADAAVACLRAALRIGDDRAAALHLLAADALITAACDIAGGTEQELAAVATRFAAGRLATDFRDELAAAQG